MKRLEFKWLEYRHTLSRYVTCRFLSRVVLLVLLIVAVIWSYRRVNRPVFFTSSIACKSKIAQIVIPNEKLKLEYLKPMGINYHELETDFFYFVSTMTVNCQNQVHLGPPEDGGWEVCLDPRYDIISPCLIYSFGINNDFRFEKAAEEYVGCEVHAFDPSMQVESHQYSEKGYFHNYGIDSIETTVSKINWRLRRLENIMKELGHEGRQIDYLKMDIEFSEWPVLYDLIQTRLIDKVRQLALEVHTPEMDIHTRPENVCTWSTVETMAFMMKTLLELKKSGFSLYYTRTNHRTKFTSPITGFERYCCHDLHFVNVKLRWM